MKVQNTNSEVCHLAKNVSLVNNEFSNHWTKEEQHNDANSPVDDLTALTPLTEDAVIQTVEERFKAGVYYTWAGIPLVAVNPCQDIDELYDEETEANYRRKSAVEARELPPHIFAIGQKAYCDLKRGFETSNQSIIISGESGAGKTWTARTLMQFISDMAEKSPCDRTTSIEQRILDSNPVLEAFGNACTLRNENSSRFGKYIQLQFDRENHIVGAKIKTYLLEKTRVVHQAPGEKNFHIFYQMTSTSELENPRKTRRRSSRWGGEDRQAFILTCEAMRNIGIQDDLQAEIFKTLKGIQTVCKVDFEEAKTSDELCNFANSEIAKRVCSLLELDEERFNKCINTRRITAGSTGEQFMKPCLVEECLSRRDCVVKLIYSRLFDWIVDFINTSIKAPSHLKHAFIGLLDVYGFESFKDNSLEQLCINYANEKLQQHFVCHFLKKQQDEYQKEDIDWSFQDFSDNRLCLDVIEGRVSVFSMMNEECRLNRAVDDQGFCDRLHSSLESSKYFHQMRLKSQRPEFVIQHYAESVCYQVKGMVEKNKDHTALEVLELLQSSKNLFLSRLFSEERQQQQQKKQENNISDNPTTAFKKPRQSNVTVVSKFKKSLDRLMSTLTSTSVHYIRCIRPNAVNIPSLFDRKQVLNQLRSCGVMETIRICAAGYPVRLTHREFIKRYNFAVTFVTSSSYPLTPAKAISTPPPSKPDTPRSHGSISRTKKADRRSRRRRRSGYDHTPIICQTILESIGCFADVDKENTRTLSCGGFKLGRTKIFLSEDIIEKLEIVRERFLSRSAFTIQCCWRRYKKRIVGKINMAATVVQKVFKGWLERKRYLILRKATITIQRHLRCFLLRNKIATSQASLQEDLPLEDTLIREKYSTNFSKLKNEVLPYDIPLYVDTCGMSHSSWFDPYVSTLYDSLVMEKRQAIAHGMELLDSIHRGPGIASIRRIECMPIVFHCRRTPLTNAETRPLNNMEINKIKQIPRHPDVTRKYVFVHSTTRML